MNVDTGEIMDFDESVKFENNFIGIEEAEMTDKQKNTRKVSLYDRRSVLGKKLTKERSKRRGSNITPKKKKRKKKLKK